MEQLKSILTSAIRDRVFPGCVLGVVTSDGQRTIIPAGNFTYEKGATSIKPDSIFDVASITKSIPTSCLALQLIEAGVMELETPAKKYIPELSMSGGAGITLKHLLTQTLDWGFPLASLKDKAPDEILNTIFTAEFKSPPGTKFFYSNATSILLGMVVERAAGRALDVLADEKFFQPLRMDRTSFHPEKFSKDEIVPTEIDTMTDHLLQGELHDESARKLQEKMIVGSAGVFSTVPDLLNFLEMLLRGGELGGQRYFSPEMVQQMSQGLGWENNNPTYMGKYAKTIFGKTGFTGCVVMADLTKGRALAMLSNHIHPRRSKTNEILHGVRRTLADAVFNNNQT